MSELDVLLRESIGRLAEPGDPTGVVGAIRARVEASGSSTDGSSGDGSPKDGGSGAGGSGGASSGITGAGRSGSGIWGGWTPFGILIGLSVAGGAGLALATQQPAEGGAVPLSPLPFTSSQGVSAAACPGGPAVATLDPGARLLALRQSADGAYYAVRDPQALGTVVWVAEGVAVVDPGQDPDALPVGGCEDAGEIVPIVTEAPPEPEPQPDPAPAPAPAPRPGPGGGGSTPPPAPTDVQKPTIQVGNWSESYTCTVDVGYGPASASISITVGDNVGVTSVTASSPTPGVSLSGPSGSGSTRTFTVSRSGNTDAVIQVTFTVKDAAGNTVTGSAPGLDSLGGGSCLI